MILIYGPWTFLNILAGYATDTKLWSFLAGPFFRVVLIASSSKGWGNVFFWVKEQIDSSPGTEPMHVWASIWALIFFFLIFKNIYFWLPWVFVAAGLSCSWGEQGLRSSCGTRASRCGGFSCCRARALRHRVSSFTADGIFLDQRRDPCLLHWQVILHHWATREAPSGLSCIIPVGPGEQGELTHKWASRCLLSLTWESHASWQQPCSSNRLMYKSVSGVKSQPERVNSTTGKADKEVWLSLPGFWEEGWGSPLRSQKLGPYTVLGSECMVSM